MGKKKIVLTPDDKRLIDAQEVAYKQLIETIERGKQFKDGDYLVMFVADYKGGWVQQKGTYGAPTKYKVIHVTDSGLPFMKEITSNGTPTGELYSGVGLAEDDNYLDTGSNVRWELDPDYADSLLLQDDYDPATMHKNKAVLWKEVTEHNKKAKVNTTEINGIATFLSTLKMGDTIWTSNVSHLLVREVRVLARPDAQKACIKFGPRIKGPHILVVTVVDKKGAVKDVAADHFYHKALYRERPRTYKELHF